MSLSTQIGYRFPSAVTSIEDTGPDVDVQPD